MFILHSLIATWGIIEASAFWLLFGFLLAGVIHELLPPRIIERHLRKPGAGSVFKASAFGVPLPLCSCSVIPVAVSLRKHGASKGAVASFMVSTPEIGVDSFFFSYALLGPLLAIARLVAAFFSALTVGLMTDRLDASEPSPASPQDEHSCCHHTAEIDLPNTFATSPTVFRRLVNVFHFGFIELIDDLSGVLVVGLLLSGVVTALVPADFFTGLGLGPYSLMFVMLFVSLPLYVCATSSTPLAAALLSKGLNPGAALVFLLAGPATNVATMLVVRRELGNRGLFVYLTGITVVALLSGTILNFAFPTSLHLPGLASQLMSHEHSRRGFQWASYLLAGLLLASITKKGANRFFNPPSPMHLQNHDKRCDGLRRG